MVAESAWPPEEHMDVYHSLNAGDFPPKDKFAACYISFFLIGAGLLFPWNVVVTAVDYFNLIFPGEQMEFWFSVSYMSADFIGLIAMLKWGANFSFRVRIVPGFILFLGVTGAFYFVHDKYVSLILMAVLGLTEAVLTGSAFALAGHFPARYTTACMSGVGAAGVIVSGLRNITKGVMAQNDDGIKKSALLYFLIAEVFLLLCNVAYIFGVERSPVTRYYLSPDRHERGILTETDQFRDHDHSDTETERTRLRSVPYGDATDMNSLDSRADEVITFSSTTSARGKRQSLYRRVFGKVWIPAVSVCVTFWITLGLFPGLTSEMKSESQSLNDNQWFALLLISTFDVADLIGRSLPLWESCIVWVNAKNIWMPAFGRLVFIPLIILCIQPRLVTKDYLAYIIMFVFAVTNGYIGTLCMSFAPALVDQDEKAAAGTLMIFCLTCGLTSGVWSGLGATKLLDRYG